MQSVNLTNVIRRGNPFLDALASLLESKSAALSLSHATLYHDFPVYRDDAGELLKSQLLLASPAHGLVLFAVSPAVHASPNAELDELNDRLDQLFSTIYSRLLRVRALQESRTQLKFPVSTAIYAPNLAVSADSPAPNNVLPNSAAVEQFLGSIQIHPLGEAVVSEMQSVIEGAKGMTRPKSRPTAATNASSIAAILSRLEADIATFDIQQRDGYITEMNGPQRIRGLAGSGKTVVLSMKAALTHLRNPDATILYTFYTKSLYQHIKRSITRFYRQFDDRDPDWDRIHILHGWGGASIPGVYYEACVRSGIDPVTFDAATRAGSRDPFDAICTQLSASGKVQATYDYVFIDEGQDFPSSFVRLCAELARDRKFVLAYDDLQTIFRPTTPTAAEIFGTTPSNEPLIDFEEDIVLHKCYRNPREVLVTAHALGFGIYSNQIVQMLENETHWEDIGYRVTGGTFVKGSQVTIERPQENSPVSLVGELPVDTIVSAAVFDNYETEIRSVVADIKAKILDGLRPDDILVACVDDRNAKQYLQSLDNELRKVDIAANNIHTNSFGLRDFYLDDNVTLSTVHKAKGNESFVVYVIGVDALFAGRPGVRERNILFTAMTRAKGVVHISGVGPPAERCKRELESARSRVPKLEFVYPGSEEMKRIRRDWRGRAIKRRRDAEQQIDSLLRDLTPEELVEYIHRSSKTGHRKPRNLS